MSRGGFFPIHVGVLLSGEQFPELSLAGLGAWVRLRGLCELSEAPAGRKALARCGVGDDELDQLVGSGLATETDGAYQAVGMPGLSRKPSDEPAAIRERVQRFREKGTERESPESIQSNPIQSNAVTRYGALPDGDDRSFEEYERHEKLRNEHERNVAYEKARKELAGLPISGVASDA
jgi:hypothetical protein